MPERKFLLLWLLLLPLLPACSLLPTQPLEGFPPDALQQALRQSAELEGLRKLNTATPEQQQKIQQLHSNLRQFEQNVIRAARRLEQQGDWQAAERLFDHASDALPDSRTLATAQEQLAERRQLREERVRMELAINRGEQLLKNVGPYQQLQQVEGPGPLIWLQLKRYRDQCRDSAEELKHYAQQALARREYSLAHRGLKIAQRLYGEDYQGEDIKRDLAQIKRHLDQRRQAKRQAAKPPRGDETAKKLGQALEAGNLLSAKQHLERLREQSPQHPQLVSLQSQFQTQLNILIESAIRRGSDLYSRGDIHRALNIWRQAQTLAPKNVTLLANITRAELVLENLRMLSTSPTVEF